MDDARRDRGGVGRGTGEGGGYVTEGQRRVSGNAARLGSFHRSTESTARKIREEGWKNAVYSRGVRVNLLAAARAHSAHRWLRSNSPTRRIGSHRRRQRRRDPSLFGEVNGRTREKRRRMEGGRRKKKKGEERERESGCRVGGPITLRFRAQEQHVQPGNKTLSFKAEAKPR